MPIAEHRYLEMSLAWDTMWQRWHALIELVEGNLGSLRRVPPFGSIPQSAALSPWWSLQPYLKAWRSPTCSSSKGLGTPKNIWTSFMQRQKCMIWSTQLSIRSLALPSPSEPSLGSTNYVLALLLASSSCLRGFCINSRSMEVILKKPPIYLLLYGMREERRWRNMWRNSARQSTKSRMLTTSCCPG